MVIITTTTAIDIDKLDDAAIHANQLANMADALHMAAFNNHDDPGGYADAYFLLYELINNHAKTIQGIVEAAYTNRKQQDAK